MSTFFSISSIVFISLIISGFRFSVGIKSLIAGNLLSEAFQDSKATTCFSP